MSRGDFRMPSDKTEAQSPVSVDHLPKVDRKLVPSLIPPGSVGPSPRAPRRWQRWLLRLLATVGMVALALLMYLAYFQTGPYPGWP
jgi:hypothetical protein